MNTATFDPFNNLVLDDYEQRLEDKADATVFLEGKEKRRYIKALQSIAENMINERDRTNVFPVL